jgi:Ca2+-binding RTX toxin-like protein
MKSEKQKFTRQPNRLKTHVLSTAVRQCLGLGSAAVMLSISPMVLSNSAFGPVVELSALSGADGFVLNGGNANDWSGYSVSSAGDINGDGVDDLIIGAPLADPNGSERAGTSYLVFGGSGLGSSGTIDLSGLSGADGFVLNGVDEYDRSGSSVSAAGDINGDGVDDLIIGAPLANPNGNSGAGQSYLVFGGSGVGSTGAIDLSTLNGTDGFVLNGADFLDRSGHSVSGVGDINGDGVDDLIIGANEATPNGKIYAGQTHVVFGGSGVGGTGTIELSTLNNTDGFFLNGVDFYDSSGASVSGAGDINGDGVDDLIIGTNPIGDYGNYIAGESYVVFGGSDVGRISLSTLTGTKGFVINGVDESDYAGRSVSAAGDINGDGMDDLIIGAFLADPNGNNGAGESYVVFGSSEIGSTGEINLSALSSTEGFVINGVDSYDRSGGSVSGAGDVNGDGVDDLIIGAFLADPNGLSGAGASYVVFGGNEVGSSGEINLSTLSGADGFVLNGVDAGDFSGSSVSGAGDVNGDGVDDLIIGAYRADPNGNSDAGASYVVFGSNGTPVFPSGPDNDQFINAETLIGVSDAVASGSTLTVGGTTAGATPQGGEPAHFPGGFGLPSGPLNSIWYRWTAEADQIVEIDTAGSEVETALVAYTGATVSSLQEIGRGIDNVRQVSRIRFAARAGETYHLAVDGYNNNSEGDIQLNIREPVMDLSECTIIGTDGPDVITGTTGPDVICALGGDDNIKSLGGADIIFAGSGHDFVSSGGGKDIVFGEDGNDVVVGGSGNDVLSGGLLGDRIFAGRGDDIVFGSSGADRLFGSDGNDALFGEMGGDRLFGGSGSDFLDGGPFNDLCAGNDGDDTLENC